MGGNYLDRDIFTCVIRFFGFVLGLHGGFQECHLVHGQFYCEHDGVMVLWRSVCGIFGHRFQIAKTSSMYLHKQVQVAS